MPVRFRLEISDELEAAARRLGLTSRHIRRITTASLKFFAEEARLPPRPPATDLKHFGLHLTVVGRARDLVVCLHAVGSTRFLEVRVSPSGPALRRSASVAIKTKYDELEVEPLVVELLRTELLTDDEIALLVEDFLDFYLEAKEEELALTPAPRVTNAAEHLREFFATLPAPGKGYRGRDGISQLLTRIHTRRLVNLLRPRRH